jgi:Tetratricopeptide repeat
MDWLLVQPQHRQALRVRETVLGKEHPDTLTSMNNLATVLKDQGKYEQAEEMLRQIFGLSETVLGNGYLSTLMSMNNLTMVLRVSKLGQLAKSKTSANHQKGACSICQPVGTVDALLVCSLHAQNLFPDGICLHFAPCSLCSKCQSNCYSPIVCYLFFYLLERMRHSDSTIVSQTLAMVAVPAWYNMSW